MLRSIVVFAALACGMAGAGPPLDSLRKTHPRLIALDSDIARIRSLVRSDPQAGAIYAEVKRHAAKIETEPPVEFKLIGPRLLDKSRRCLERVYTLALLYRLDGDRKYIDRALKELRAAAAFPNWNPSHFLDVAEMTHAFAIGYDWLYPALTAEDKDLLRTAIVKKGIDEAIPIYKQHGWWSKSNFNWNQVCNGGITIGALAIADEEPEKAAYVLGSSVESIKLAMASYAPDGGWAEGPGYWHYATRYNVYFLAALESALGTDFDLSTAPGFSNAGDFRVYFEGPTRLSFNYADAHAGAGNAAEMFWLARKFSEPVFAWHELDQLKHSKPDALDLIWYRPEAKSPTQAAWPLDRVFRGVEVAFLRSAWEDPKAIFIGVKGGDNKANHGHLDLGSFVLDAHGVRWAEDLGSDDYNLPQYFGKLRWTYYRLRTESHNTVLIDGENQETSAKAKITGHEFSPGRSQVRIDLSQAYPGKVSRFERTVALVDRKQVIVADEVEAARPVDALWGMVTRADVTVNGKNAQLQRDGAALHAEIVAPANAVFEVADASAPAPQNRNRGARKLVVRLPGKVTRARIEVRFH